MDPEILEALRRDSGIRLDAEGGFHHRGGPVANPRVQALFHRGLSVREDGEVVLTVGHRWCYVACAGVARFVEALRFGAEGIEARTRGAGVVAAASARFGYGPDDRVYVWLPGQDGPALLLRPAHLTLLTRVDERGLIDLGGGARTALVQLARVPGPADPPPGAP